MKEQKIKSILDDVTRWQMFKAECWSLKLLFLNEVKRFFRIK